MMGYRTALFPFFDSKYSPMNAEHRTSNFTAISGRLPVLHEPFLSPSGSIAAGHFRVPILSEMKRQYDQALAGMDHRIDGHAIPDEQGR